MQTELVSLPDLLVELLVVVLRLGDDLESLQALLQQVVFDHSEDHVLLHGARLHDDGQHVSHERRRVVDAVRGLDDRCFSPGPRTYF